MNEKNAVMCGKIRKIVVCDIARTSTYDCFGCNSNVFDLNYIEVVSLPAISL